MFSFKLTDDIEIIIDGTNMETYPVKPGTNIIIPVSKWNVKSQDILTRHFPTGSKAMAVNIGAEVYKIVLSEGFHHIVYPNSKFFTHTTREWATEGTFFKIGSGHLYGGLVTTIPIKDGLIIGFICKIEDVYYPDVHVDTRNNKKISRVIKMISESNATITYEILAYEDGTYSCNCPGWTKRVDQAGYRTCKHVKKVMKS